MFIVAGSPICSGAVWAQGRTYHYKYQDTLSELTEIQSLKSDLFGDSVSYVDGGISFRVTDLEVPNGPGPRLVFARRMTPRRTLDSGLVGAAALDDKTLGDLWQAEVPAIRGTYPTNADFVTGKFPRCSRGRLAPDAVRTYPYNSLQSIVFPYNFWHGLTLSLPGSDDENLHRLAASALQPTDGKTYLYQTMGGARVSCLAQLKRGPGEGFLVVTPTGLRYYFDLLVLHKERGLRVADGSSIGSTVINRTAVTFYASRVEDVHGNAVTYTFDPAHPHQLIRMEASSGAAIDLAYDTNGRIVSVRSDDRRWNYSYVAVAGAPQLAWLQRVIQPDGSAWDYSYQNYVFAYNQEMGGFGDRCNFNAGSMTSIGNGPLASFSATHPSGAHGEFTFKAIVHGYNNVPSGSCAMVAGSTAIYRLMSGRPKATPLSTLVKKVISGPGISPMVWDFAYAPSWSYASECKAGCPSTSTTTVTRNDGVVEKYVFGNDFQRNANQLLQHLTESAGQVLRSEHYRYVENALGQPFPDTVAGPDGEELGNSLDNPLMRKNRPQSERSIEQDGATFTDRVLSFDALARPLQIQSTSSN